jgi:GT2 family glycosyltransferase
MLSIVLPVCRSAPRTKLALLQLVGVVRAEVPDAEIIVVNDGMCTEVSRVVKGVIAGHPLTRVFLVEQEQGGRSRARNQGASQAAGNLLVFMDGDVLLQPGAITAHLRLHAMWQQALVRGTILHLPCLAAFDDPVEGTLTPRAKQSLGIVDDADRPVLLRRRVSVDERGHPAPDIAKGARMSRFEKDIHEWLGSRTTDQPHRWVGCTGAHISISRDSFRTLGGFDESMGLRWGAEDMEFGYRAEKKGIRIIHALEAVVCHMDHDVSGRNGDHGLSLEYFSAKHHDPIPFRLKRYFDGNSALEEVFV